MKTLVIATLLFVPVLMAAGPRDEVPTGDLAKLQGKWAASAGRKGDIAVAIEIEGRAVKVDVKTKQGIKVHAEGELKIDETASPKSIDWVGFTAKDGQDLPEVLAIYELDGDTLKVANGGPNNPRPTDFKAGDGALADLVTLKRKAKVAGGEAAPKGKTSVALDRAKR